MIPAYNPFEILNVPMLKILARQGVQYIVLQRFNWPGIKEGYGFIATPYARESDARKHEAQLFDKEGRTLSLVCDIEKLNRLTCDPMYYFFLSTFRDPQWNVRILTRYEGNITSFLEANVPGHVKNAHEIQFRLEFGRLMAAITVGNREFQFNVYSMIKSSPRSI